MNKIFKIIFREEVTSAVDRNKLEARLELEIRNIKEKNKKYADYLASLSEDEKDKEEEVYEEFLNKNDNFLSMLMSAEELQVELEWKFREEFKKESLKEGNHNVQRLPDLSLPTFSGNSLKLRFAGIIDSQPILETQKLQYLEGCLKEKAKEFLEVFFGRNSKLQGNQEILIWEVQKREALVKRTLFTELQKVPKCVNHITEIEKWIKNLSLLQERRLSKW